MTITHRAPETAHNRPVLHIASITVACEELAEGRQESIGALDVGHVAAAWDHGGRTLPEAAASLA